LDAAFSPFLRLAASTPLIQDAARSGSEPPHKTFDPEDTQHLDKWDAFYYEQDHTRQFFPDGRIPVSRRIKVPENRIIYNGTRNKRNSGRPFYAFYCHIVVLAMGGEADSPCL
jgi:hypothetical protein